MSNETETRMEFDIMNEMLDAEKAQNMRTQSRATDFKRVQRRQGTSVKIMENFAMGMQRFRQKNDERDTFSSIE